MWFDLAYETWVEVKMSPFWTEVSRSITFSCLLPCIPKLCYEKPTPLAAATPRVRDVEQIWTQPEAGSPAQPSPAKINRATMDLQA